MVNKAIEFKVLLFFLCLRFKPDMKEIFFYVLYLSVVIVFHKSKILIKNSFQLLNSGAIFYSGVFL